MSLYPSVVASIIIAYALLSIFIIVYPTCCRLLIVYNPTV